MADGKAQRRRVRRPHFLISSREIGNGILSQAPMPAGPLREYIRDAHGNLVEHHVSSGPPRGNSRRLWNGYRIEIEYAVLK